MIPCIYNLEYNILDKLGRAKKTTHVGIFSDLDRVEKAKEAIATKISDRLSFNVYVIPKVL